MRKFRALLIGLGQIGFRYDAHLTYKQDQPDSTQKTLTHSRALICHPRFELIGGIDPCAEAREKFSTLYGVASYADLRQWHDSGAPVQPDLVVVAVPPQMQVQVVHELLAMVSPRLLLLEKPIATNLEQADCLIESCLRLPNLRVAVNYIRCYLPAVLEWKHRLARGELGSLLFGQIIYGKGLLLNGSHFVNLAQAWLGPLHFKRLIRSGSLIGSFDCEASVELMVENHREAPLMIQSVGDAGLRAGELDLWFEQGRLRWRNDGRSVDYWARCPPQDPETHASLTRSLEHHASGIDHYQYLVAGHLADLLDDQGLQPQCTLVQARQTLAALMPALNETRSLPSFLSHD